MTPQKITRMMEKEGLETPQLKRRRASNAATSNRRARVEHPQTSHKQHRQITCMQPCNKRTPPLTVPIICCCFFLFVTISYGGVPGGFHDVELLEQLFAREAVAAPIPLCRLLFLCSSLSSFSNPCNPLLFTFRVC